MIKLLNILKEITSENYIIYQDIDGCLADFDKAFKNLTGYLPKDFESKFGIDEFWKAIPENTTDFWVNLEWMEDGKQLWNYIKKYNPILLSAPSRAETSKQGKKEWVEKELPGVKLILKGAKYKHEYAKPNAILIDDRKDNIERWESAGGIGIFHISAKNTINLLQQLGL
jgi:FMN phosphatase YigB (HAD superfamily)